MLSLLPPKMHTLSFFINTILKEMHLSINNFNQIECLAKIDTETLIMASGI